MRRAYISGIFLCVLVMALGAKRALADDVPITSQAPNHRASTPSQSPGKGIAQVAKTQPQLAARNANASPAKGSSSTGRGKLPHMVIIVTATRIAQPLGEIGETASVLERHQIQSQQIHNVTDALREMPSIDVTQSGSPGTIAEVSIRGATPAQTLAMIDGVPLNDSATGSFDFSRLTTDDLDRIEVVRGAGGALYGSQAIGGVINLITREGSGPMKFALTSEGGNRATQRQVLTVDGAESKLAYSGALSYFSTTGFRPKNDNSDNLTGALRLDYHFDENTTLRGFARYIRANVSLPTFSVFAGIPLNPNAHQRNEFMLYKGEVDRQFGDRILVRLSGYFVRDELRLNAVPFARNRTSETAHIPDESRGANLETIYTWAEGFRSLIGFDFKDRWVHSQDDFVTFAPPPPARFLTVFNARRQEYAGYFEQEARLFDGHLLATGGFRVDGNTNFGEEVSPAWSVAIPFEKQGLTLRGSYAEGFRAPSFDELFFPGFGNPNLNPEISSEYDGGITKTFGETAQLTATYFSRRVHSQIVTVPCTFNAKTCPDGAHPGNAERVDTEGVEIVPSIQPIRGLTLGGSVTILDETHAVPRNVIPRPQPLRVPKYSAQALIEYTHAELLKPGDRLTTALAYTFVGDRDDITTTSSILNHDAYHRFDLTVSYSPGIRWGAVRNEQVFTRIQNLFDRHYAEAFGFRAPPVNFVAGMKVEF
jgi:vitamin B12 transporter